MLVSCKKKTGYLGFESARNKLGIAISYQKTIEDIKNKKVNLGGPGKTKPRKTAPRNRAVEAKRDAKKKNR